MLRERGKEDEMREARGMEVLFPNLKKRLVIAVGFSVVVAGEWEVDGGRGAQETETLE